MPPWVRSGDSPSCRVHPLWECKLQTKLQTNYAARLGPSMTRQDDRSKNAERERTLSYYAARASMRILELFWIHDVTIPTALTGDLT